MAAPTAPGARGARGRRAPAPRRSGAPPAGRPAHDPQRLPRWPARVRAPRPGPARSEPGTRTDLPLDDERLALRLEELADLLAAQDANPFRVRAYRGAAASVRALGEPVRALLAREGQAGLTRLPGIGASLARTIEALVHTDHLDLLERLRGRTGPRTTLTSVPGIGPTLARRVEEELGIESLAELEAAAHDGRLARVPGFGRGRVRAVRESLAGRFRRWPALWESRRGPTRDEPPVAELLDVDREYRARAAARRLPRVAPRRFNPTAAAWLPILRTERGERHYTALFSNTARAHELGTTRDWVVIYRDDHGGDGQWTVVTARLGALRGQRIVRGRERECLARAGPGAAEGPRRPGPSDP